uniref:Calponin-homology (CH) domain-containing protein n=1 Tax=Caenorhabditis japonica TaxID=281687 RepID=A0A8R1HJF9_CAEJA
MIDLTNSDGGTSSDNANSSHHRYGTDSMDSDGPGRSSSRRFVVADEPTIQQNRMDLADLAIWLSGLKATEFPLDNPHDLCNGRAFAELLHEIDKDFFDSDWLDKMPMLTTPTNIVVKRSNLRRLWRKISDYITDQLHRKLPTACRWTEISERVDGFEESDLPVAVDLGMIVVTLAHIGRTQETYVQYSQSLSSKYQREIANVARMISLVMEEFPETLSGLDVSLLDESAHEQKEICMQESTSHAADGKTSRRHTLSNSESLLEAQRESHCKEKDQLLREVDRLTKALDAALLNATPSTETNVDVSLLERQNEKLRFKKREIEERFHELEAQIEQHRLNLKDLTEENDKLRSGHKDLNLVRSELHSARDAVEEWRAKATKYSEEVEVMKKRKEKEVKDLELKLDFMNSRIENFVKESTISEDNKKTMDIMRSKIGTLEANIDQMQRQEVSKSHMVNELENKLIEYKERVNELNERKDELVAERNLLQEQLALIQNIVQQLQKGAELLPSPFSEKPQELPQEITIKRLRERIQELETLEPLQGEIIILKSRIGVLEEENLVLSKRKEDLQREVNEYKEKELEKSQKLHVSNDVLELKVQIEKANVELERLREVQARGESRSADLESLVELRTRELEKEKDLLFKAKQIIDELELRSRPVGEDSITSVQQFKELQEENEQLREKVERLAIELHNVSSSLDHENRLFNSAAHQMVLNRSIDDATPTRTRAGADSVPPQTLLETQKMSGALPWRYT